jgi:hypothetical protein
MTMIYELWDTESRNLVAEFDSRDDAISAVRQTLNAQGRSAIETLLLGTEDGDGGGEVIARGAELIALAERPAAPIPPARTPRVAD